MSQPPRLRWLLRKPLSGLGVAALALTGIVLAGPHAEPALAATDVVTVDFSQSTGEFHGGATGTLYGFGSADVPTRAIANGAHVTNSSSKPPYGLQHPTGDMLSYETDFFAKHGQYLSPYLQDFYAEWYYNGSNRPPDVRTYDQTTGQWTGTTETGPNSSTGVWAQPTAPNGVWDYLEVVDFVTTRIAEEAEYPGQYLLIPFNEAEANWYSRWSETDQYWPGESSDMIRRGNKDTFCADWVAIYEKINEVYAAHGFGKPRIGGGGWTGWKPTQTRDALTCMRDTGTLPDVFIWHELSSSGLTEFPAHMRAYEAILDDLGLPRIPVNISEWGSLHDMSAPGRVMQWLINFENEKVDAQTSYWNAAGTLSDNVAGVNGANGGWWTFKWYGDLEGSETVATTTPSNAADQTHALAAIDHDDTRATVLVGGTSTGQFTLDATGLDPAEFGDTVDIEVREIGLTGAEGVQGNPRVVLAKGGAALAADGSLDDITVDVPYFDRAYQVLITPDQDRDVEAAQAAQPWRSDIEAEDTVLGGPARTRSWTTYGSELWRPSGGSDVAWFNTAAASATWTVDVPRDGTYRLEVIRAGDGQAGRHALYVDDELDQLVQYAANLANDGATRAKWKYRGSDTVDVELTAGSHTLSLRASDDGGATALPHSDVALDRFILTDVTDGDPTTYPASTWRNYGGARMAYGDPVATTNGSVRLAGEARSDLYVTAWESGYHDVTVDWATEATSSVSLTVNGTPAATVESPAAGEWRSQATIYLAEGINEIEVRSPSGAHVAGLTTVRNRSADDEHAHTLEAESATLHGAATAVTRPTNAGTNASGGGYVTGAGQGEDNYALVPRDPKVAGAGDYAVTVSYSNQNVSGSHAYNPQVVDVRLSISEESEDATYTEVGSSGMRYTNHWESFWDRTITVRLGAGDDPLKFQSAALMEPWSTWTVPPPWGAAAPAYLDKITIAPVQVGPIATQPLRDLTGPTVTVKPESTGRDGVYSTVSFKLFDAHKVDRLTLNGVVKDLSDNVWSDLNRVEPGAYGATPGTNVLKVYDVAGNETTLSFVLDVTSPTVTVKTGENESVGSPEDGYEKVSFKLFDAHKVDRLTLNGVVKDLVDNAWSDLNDVGPGSFGAVLGENELMVYDVAGNARTVTFTLVEPEP
ncbi:hypothetical protein MF406_01075 [Georgenia sp. TF02-10]|uniref:hypothetical protein n=1 Tax=Georgenia sp. TF02-10 TaxID=2917725 RepID=UPI001FA6C5D9|nr:hypothetical protein [Georgenia sp. TF02-10]UNX54921.1 hypothetical protein MF406_01075 [Georgenia sp. TF02-10]